MGASGLRENAGRMLEKRKAAEARTQALRFRTHSMLQVACTRQRRSNRKSKKQTTFPLRMFYVLLGSRRFTLQNGRHHISHQRLKVPRESCQPVCDSRSKEKTASIIERQRLKKSSKMFLLRTHRAQKFLRNVFSFKSIFKVLTEDKPSIPLG